MSNCPICGRKIKTKLFSSPPGFSKKSGKLYKNYSEASFAEGLKNIGKDLSPQECIKYFDKYWLPVCQECYHKNAEMPVEYKLKEDQNQRQFELINHEKKLIPCPDCEKEVSRRAKACPYCGCPIEELGLYEIDGPTKEIAHPKLPDDLTIGQFKADWGRNNIKAIYRQRINTIMTIKPGEKLISFHEDGISIASSLFDVKAYCIHFSQILDCQYTCEPSLIEYVEKEKSVIGRALVGTLIAGPIGAIVGGISGVGTKKIGEFDFLIINFWDVSETTIRPQSIILGGNNKKKQFERFAAELNQRVKKYVDAVRWPL
jgi:hypothetical protein